MATMQEIRNELASFTPSNADKLKMYTKVFKPEFKRFIEAPRFRVNKPTEHDLLTFGEKLERQSMINTMANEAVSFSTQMGGEQTIVGLDYVTTAEINNILPLIAADQVGSAATMNDKIGIVRYEKVLAGTTRGNVTAGQVLQGAAEGPEVYPAGFAGERQIGEDFTDIVANTKEYNGTLDFAPIRQGYVTVTLPNNLGCLTDNGNGQLIGAAGVGTINYSTGAWTLTLAAAPTAAGKALVSYDSNFELGVLPSISLVFDAKVVKAQVYGLQSDTSILTQYLMQKTFNYDTQKRAIEIVQQQLLNEQISDLIAKIKVACTENSIDLTQFDLTRPTNISQQAHNETIDLAFKQVAKKLARRSGQGDLSVALCGPDASTIIQGLSKFKPLGKVNAFATLIGIYDDNTLIINCPQIAEAGKVYFLNKGDSPFLAAAVNMVAMPLVASEDVPVSYNLTQRRSAVFTLAAIDVLNPSLIQQFAVTNSPFPIGQ